MTDVADIANALQELSNVLSLSLTVQLISSFGLQVKVRESEESIADHENFHDSLLNLEKWLMIMKQKLESFHSPSGEWSVEGRQHEAEVCGFVYKYICGHDHQFYWLVSDIRI